MVIQRSLATSVKIMGMWIFLAPLIVILGTIDVLTKGRSRSWPFDDEGPSSAPSSRQSGHSSRSRE